MSDNVYTVKQPFMRLMQKRVNLHELDYPRQVDALRHELDKALTELVLGQRAICCSVRVRDDFAYRVAGIFETLIECAEVRHEQK